MVQDRLQELPCRDPNLRFVPWEEFRAATSEEHAQATWEHIARSPPMSIDKARTRLGNQPRYTSLETAHEAVHQLVRNGHLALDLSPAQALETFRVTPSTG